MINRLDTFKDTRYYWILYEYLLSIIVYGHTKWRITTKAGIVSSVRSPAPNGRYRALAPSALTKLLAFCADRRPATLPALPIESPRRRRPPRSTTNNNLLFQRAWRFPLQGTANPDGPGTTGLEGAPRRYQVSPAHPPSHPSSVPRLQLSIPLCVRIPARRAPRIRPADPRRLLIAPTNNRRLIRHLRDSRQLYDQTRTVSLKHIYPYHGPRFPCPWAGGLAQNPITLEFIQQVPTKALSEIGYEAPQDVVKTNRESDPVSSRASSRATSPMKTNKIKINARRAHRPTKERRAPTAQSSVRTASRKQ
ncbi:hypothetical protein EVAR_29068_1 [Eumeta japonica]|uniref:Uncharacterized protein n=1 Tax=Eumeta variegata TaxID=151549 RepID=A0A4C1VL82_EUMVA|nr:hypothetical protein EVAR_29068_1 [Eumeta japonica]